MLSLQAVTLFQVVTKLINRNWFPVRFILKLLSALLVNRRKDIHYWFKLLHQQVKHMPKFTYKTYNRDSLLWRYDSRNQCLKVLKKLVSLML